nr:hypothetical protein [Lentzea albidocapillata]
MQRRSWQARERVLQQGGLGGGAGENLGQRTRLERRQVSDDLHEVAAGLVEGDLVTPAQVLARHRTADALGQDFGVGVVGEQGLVGQVDGRQRLLHRGEGGGDVVVGEPFEDGRQLLGDLVPDVLDESVEFGSLVGLREFRCREIGE